MRFADGFQQAELQISKILFVSLCLPLCLHSDIGRNHKLTLESRGNPSTWTLTIFEAVEFETPE
jgi:hypothetical protein